MEATSLIRHIRFHNTHNFGRIYLNIRKTNPVARTHIEIAISGQLRRLLGSAQRTGEHAPLRETLGKRLTQPFAGGTSLIAANVSQRNIGAAGVLSGFAPHGLPVTQQHQAARGDCGSGIASQLSFSHVSTLADASCVFIPFRHVSRTYSGMFSDALHWFHE